MRKSRFSESQIVEILKAAESGVAVVDLMRKHSISKAFPQLASDDIRACLAYAAERERRTSGTPVG